MIMKNVFLMCCSVIFLGAVCAVRPADAGLAIDAQSIATKVKDIAQAEIRAKMKDITGGWIDLRNDAIANERTLKQRVSMPGVSSTVPFQDWPSLIPESVQPKLKIEDVEDEPRLEEVQKEVQKVVFVKTKTPRMMKISRNQQDVLLLKVISYGYAAADRALALSVVADEENDKIRKEIEKTTDHLGLLMQMAKLELVVMRKHAEILHLHSRLLEASSAAGLINMTEQVDLSETALANASEQTAQ